MARKHHSKVAELFKHMFLCGVFFFTFLPLYLMLNISLKDNQQFARNPWIPTPPFHWENFVVGWAHIGDKILNTTFVAFTTTILAITFAVFGAFFFARYKAPASKFLFFIFLLLMMYPGVVNMIPTFKLICNLGLYNSHWALILTAVASAQAFTIYVLKNFIEDIPQDLFDSIEIDGGNMFHQVWHVVVPLSLPIIGTLSVLRIIAQWNSFVGPLLYLRDSKLQVIAVALLHLEGEYTKNWGELMAGYTIASIPLIMLFLFCMKLFIKGLSAGAIKG